MSFALMFNHFLNFLAPAFWLAILVPLLGRLFFKSKSANPRLWMQVAVNFAVNMLVLVIGLWYFGRDGKMASYTGMTLACTTSQWLMLRGWRSTKR